MTESKTERLAFALETVGMIVGVALMLALVGAMFAWVAFGVDAEYASSCAGLILWSSRDILTHCELRQQYGVEIDVECARSIADGWHNGQGSALYAFSSAGTFDRARLMREISDAYVAPTEAL